MNEKAVIREIKKARKGHVIWQRKGEFHYISNTHWALKIKDLPSSILGLLVSIFGLIPPKGRSLRHYYSFGDTTITDGPKVDEVFKQQTNKNFVLATSLTAKLSKSKDAYKLMEWEKGVICINSDYISMIGEGDHSYYTDGVNLPVICKTHECEFLLLPIRNDVHIERVIKSLSERIGA